MLDEIIEKINKLDKTIITTINTDSTFLIKNVFDPVAEEITVRERDDPYQIFYENLLTNVDLNFSNNDQQTNEKLIEGMAFWTDSKSNDPFSELRSQLLVAELNNLLKSKNDELKYEFIEMIKRGGEEEHMKYLLTDLQEREKTQISNNKNKKDFIVKNKPFLKITQEEKSIIKSKLKESNKIKEKLSNSCFKELLVKVNYELGKVEKILGNSQEYYSKYKLKETKEKSEGYKSILADSFLYISKKFQKIAESSEKRDENIMHARRKKKKMEVDDKKELIIKMNRKSMEEKRKIAVERVKYSEYNEKLNKFLVAANMFLILGLFSNMSVEGRGLNLLPKSYIFFRT